MTIMARFFINMFYMGLLYHAITQVYTAQSSTDSVTMGNLMSIWFGFPLGHRIYPHIVRWHAKIYRHCQVDLMFCQSPLQIIACNLEWHEWHSQHSLAISMALPLICPSLFYHWNMDYICRMDIQHNQIGYCICWSCLGHYCAWLVGTDGNSYLIDWSASECVIMLRWVI